MIRETQFRAPSGWVVLMILLAALAAIVWLIISSIRADEPAWVITGFIAGTIVLFLVTGFFVVNPNEGKVLQLFGKYVGTAREQGLRYANPFYSKRRVSLRVRNFESAHLKVNDIDGNPIEIAAVVVWRVVDTAEAVFEVDDYENYVHVQSEAALRNMATSYPYDAHDETQLSLRGHTIAIADHLRKEIHDRLMKAGVDVIEARISHLAYAPEIAAAMLQRQQAGAIIAARQRIVEGAVGMVEMALNMLSRNKIVELDEERKAAMVSNLLVVLCGDRNTQPIVNAGTLHH
jgi:regulator of protease activity HflC (stomatin/prohibitin superfamily)